MDFTGGVFSFPRVWEWQVVLKFVAPLGLKILLEATASTVTFIELNPAHSFLRPLPLMNWNSFPHNLYNMMNFF